MRQLMTASQANPCLEREWALFSGGENAQDALAGARQYAAMVHRRLYVDLDHIQDPRHDWLYVVLEAPTGVIYEIQHAGLACLHAQIEGHLIPTESTLGYPALLDLFVTQLKGAWVSMDRIPEHLDTLRAAVAHIAIPVGTSPNDFSEVLSPIAVDDTRLAEATEAHIPVTTEFGPGILVWSNSD